MFCPSCAERSSAVSTAGFLGSDAEPLRRRLTRRRAGAMMVAIHGTAGGCPGAFSPPMTDGQRELDPPRWPSLLSERDGEPRERRFDAGSRKRGVSKASRRNGPSWQTPSARFFGSGRAPTPQR